MPSTSLSPENKVTVKRALEKGSNKIYFATLAHLYVAYPNPNQWTYTNIWGAVVFLKDKRINDSFFFRIVDLTSGKGVLWEQELYQGFEYTQDRPFFHTFTTDEYLAGFLFVGEADAGVLYKKVLSRESLDQYSGKGANNQKKSVNEKKGYFGSTKKSKLDPSDFRHLSHIGWDPNKGFSAQNIDPSWRALFDQLVQLDVTEDQIAADADLIQKFVAQHGGPEPQAAQPASPSVKASAPPPPPPSKKQAPPPPPPSSVRRVPPPPPPPIQRRVAPTPPPIQRRVVPPPPPIQRRVAPPPPQPISYERRSPSPPPAGRA